MSLIPALDTFQCIPGLCFSVTRVWSSCFPECCGNSKQWHTQSPRLGDSGVLCTQQTSLPFPTVVCYQSNRDELRRRIIQWLEAEIIPDGWFSKGSNYSEILDKYFKVIQSWGQRLVSPRERETSSPIAWWHLPQPQGSISLRRVAVCFLIADHSVDQLGQWESSSKTSGI